MTTNFHSSSAETTSGSSSVLDAPGLGVGGLFVNTTTVSGTLPTMVVKIQHSPDGSTWYDVPGLATTTISSVIGVSVILSTLTPLSDHIKAVWTLGGSNPSFTFTVDLCTYNL